MLAFPTYKVLLFSKFQLILRFKSLSIDTMDIYHCSFSSGMSVNLNGTGEAWCSTISHLESRNSKMFVVWAKPIWYWSPTLWVIFSRHVIQPTFPDTSLLTLDISILDGPPELKIFIQLCLIASQPTSMGQPGWTHFEYSSLSQTSSINSMFPSSNAR